MHVITGFQIMAFTPKEKFQLMAIIDTIPTKWRHHLKCAITVKIIVRFPIVLSYI